MKQKLKATKGVTLIALVITIIVMLILVGVTVKMANDGGLFEAAQQASDETQREGEREILTAAIVPALEEGRLNLELIDDNLPTGWNVEVNSGKTEATCTSPKGNVFTVSKVGRIAYQEENGGGGGVTPETPPTEITDGTIDEEDTNWALLSKIAVAISKDDNINKNSTTATAVVEGKRYTLKVGDEFNVTYKIDDISEIQRPVRIIGFKHDKLTDKEKTGEYAGCTYAGITFDFVYFMTETTDYKMNPTNTNSGGWAATGMRRTLNGYSTTDGSQSGAIGGLGAKLSNKDYIKQVKKTYGTVHNTTATGTSEDYLWLLSCSEIWSTGYNTTGKGFSMSTEGSQYAWYKAKEKGADGNVIAYNTANSNFVKKGNSSASANWWWLRSSDYGTGSSFCKCQLARWLQCWGCCLRRWRGARL